MPQDYSKETGLWNYIKNNWPNILVVLALVLIAFAIGKWVI